MGKENYLLLNILFLTVQIILCMILVSCWRRDTFDSWRRDTFDRKIDEDNLS